MAEFNLGQTKIDRVAIIKFKMNKYCGYGGCSFQIKILPNVIEVGFTEGRYLILLGQDRVDYETESPSKVNWCQTNTRRKWKRMTGKSGKLLWPAGEKKFSLGWV